MSASVQVTVACEQGLDNDYEVPCRDYRFDGELQEKPGATAPSPSPPAAADEDAVSDTPAATELERWNGSRGNMYRFSVTIFCFAIMGMSDGATGALIPYIEDYYHISYTVLSLIFLAPFVGYLFAALSNNLIHHRFGQRGIAIIAPLCRLIGYIPLSCHPPFPALPVVWLFPGFGNGLEDSAWNAWVGNMQDANELLGFLHGAYGLGATIGPLIATAMVTKGESPLPWCTYYYVMVGLSALEACFTTTAFWRATGAVHRERHAATASGKRTTTRTVLREPITWLLATFLLGYVGSEVSLGGWIVTFMLRVRHADPFLAGLTVTFFWLGLTVGRIALGFVTGRIGEKLAISIYLLLSIILELLYWLVPSFVASAVFVSLLGFFLGPLFPAAIVAATKLLPADFHVSAIGFAAAFGSGGAAVFPFVVGAIAQSQGVEVLQPIVLATLIFILLVWLFVPGGLRRGGLEYARDRHEKPGQELQRLFMWAAGRSPS